MKALDIHENRFCPLLPPFAVDWGKISSWNLILWKAVLFSSLFSFAILCAPHFFRDGIRELFESVGEALVNVIPIFPFSGVFGIFTLAAFVYFCCGKTFLFCRVPELIRFEIFYCSSCAIIYTMAEQSLNLYCDCFHFVDDCCKIKEMKSGRNWSENRFHQVYWTIWTDGEMRFLKWMEVDVASEERCASGWNGEISVGGNVFFVSRKVFELWMYVMELLGVIFAELWNLRKFLLF